jgi:hypothetical protein
MEVPIRNKDKEVVGKAFVSPEDYEKVMKFKWHLKDKYAIGWVHTDEGRMKMFMHHFVIGKPPNGMYVDHINHNPLDNRQENLRFVTPSQNNQNAYKSANKQYIGIFFDKRNNKWYAKCSGKFKGYFNSNIEAAKAYDFMAYSMYGKNALTNKLIEYDKNIIEEIVIEKKIKPKFRENTANLSYDVKENDNIISFICSDKEIKVDKDLWNELSKYKWYIDNRDYVAAYVSTSNIRRMHHMVMDLKGVDISDIDPNKVIDHINNDRLDNRFCNLRINTISGNNHNRIKKENATSKYMGVHYFPRDDNWMAQISKDHKYHFIGYFDSQEDAALAYNIKARELYGEFSNLNDIVETEENINKIIEQINNPKKRKNATSKFRGVSFSKRDKKWNASISKSKIEYKLGRFETQEAAAKAYNQKAIELYGQVPKYNCDIYFYFFL